MLIRNLSNLGRLVAVCNVIGFLLCVCATPLRAEVIDAVNDCYLIEYDYNKEQAYPQNRNFYLTVTLKSPVGLVIPRTKQITFARYEVPENSGLKMILDAHEGRTPRNNYQTETYRFRIEIDKDTEPQVYRLKLKFQYLDQATKDRFIDLAVGQRSQGKLEVVRSETESESFVAGGQRGYDLKLANQYTDYVINIHKIAISSMPAEMLEGLVVSDIGETRTEVHGNTVIFKPYLSIRPLQRLTVPLNLKVNGMLLGNWIAGFGEGSKLVFDFEYDDGNQRVISDYSSDAKIKVRPSDWALLGTMLIGVAIGTLVKFYLEYLHGRGLVSRQGVAAFVVITVLVGVVVTVIAWGGQIQIIAFKTSGLSYDRPVAIFTMGLIGALGGVHTLNGFAKRYLPAAGPANEGGTAT